MAKVKIKYYEPINGYPDYQTRLSKNLTEIYWTGKVHERLVKKDGSQIKVDYLPTHYDLDLMHPKNIEKQEKQNNFYETI